MNNMLPHNLYSNQVLFSKADSFLSVSENALIPDGVTDIDTTDSSRRSEAVSTALFYKSMFHSEVQNTILLNLLSFNGHSKCYLHVY